MSIRIKLKPKDYFQSMEDSFDSTKKISYVYPFILLFWIGTSIVHSLVSDNSDTTILFLIVSEVVQIGLFTLVLFVVSYVVSILTRDNNLKKSIEFVLYCFMPTILGRILIIAIREEILYYFGFIITLILLFTGIKIVYRKSNAILLLFSIIILSSVLYIITSFIFLSFIYEILFKFF